MAVRTHKLTWTNHLQVIANIKLFRLPTDIQGEAIPLILGGGDVLMAAETGSGKTGNHQTPFEIYSTWRLKL